MDAEQIAGYRIELDRNGLLGAYNTRGLLDALEAAQADNEALRGQVNRYAVDAGNWRAEAAALESERDTVQAENTRLREWCEASNIVRDEAIADRDRLTNQITDAREFVQWIGKITSTGSSRSKTLNELFNRAAALLARLSPNEETTTSTARIGGAYSRWVPEGEQDS